MTLTLSVVAGPATAATAAPLAIDRRSATIGRADGCDWMLADPTRHLSSRHFDIRFDGSDYRLTDRSTNGTFLADSGQRVSPDHLIRDGDRFTAGPFTILARIDSGGAASGWSGWNDTAPPAPSSPHDGWAPADTGGGASAGWGPLPAATRSGGGNAGWQPQTGPSLVASRFTIRTRAGSPSALNSSAVASASSSCKAGAPSGAQQATGVSSAIVI